MRFQRRDLLTALAGAGVSLALPACAHAPERSLIPPPQARPIGGWHCPPCRAWGVILPIRCWTSRAARCWKGGGANTRLPPASVGKTITALYALEHLGAGYRFSTRVQATGPVKDGVLRGDLVLVGGGRSDAGYRRIGEACRASGSGRVAPGRGALSCLGRCPARDRANCRRPSPRKRATTRRLAG